MADPLLFPRIAPPGVVVAMRIHAEADRAPCVAGGRHVGIVGGPLEGDRACFAPGQSLDDGDVLGLAADPGVPYLLRRHRAAPLAAGGPARLLWELLHPSAVPAARRPAPRPRAVVAPTTWTD